MAALRDDDTVGSLDVSPPTGQTFGEIQSVPEFNAYIIDLNVVTAAMWDAAGRGLTPLLASLDKAAEGFRGVLDGLTDSLKGAAGDAVQSRGAEITKHMAGVAEAAEKFPQVLIDAEADINAFYRASTPARDRYVDGCRSIGLPRRL